MNRTRPLKSNREEMPWLLDMDGVRVAQPDDAVRAEQLAQVDSLRSLLSVGGEAYQEATFCLRDTPEKCVVVVPEEIVVGLIVPGDKRYAVRVTLAGDGKRVAVVEDLRFPPYSEEGASASSWPSLSYATPSDSRARACLSARAKASGGAADDAAGRVVWQGTWWGVAEAEEVRDLGVLVVSDSSFDTFRHGKEKGIASLVTLEGGGDENMNRLRLRVAMLCRLHARVHAVTVTDDTITKEEQYKPYGLKPVGTTQPKLPLAASVMMGIAQLPPWDGIYVVEEKRDRPGRLSVSKLEDKAMPPAAPA
jgi:hypothetical protein